MPTKLDFKWYTARAVRIKDVVEAAEEAYSEGETEEVIAHLEVAEADARSLMLRLRETIKGLNAEADKAEGGVA